MQLSVWDVQYIGHRVEQRHMKCNVANSSSIQHGIATIPYNQNKPVKPKNTNHFLDIPAKGIQHTRENNSKNNISAFEDTWNPFLQLWIVSINKS